MGNGNIEGRGEYAGIAFKQGTFAGDVKTWLNSFFVTQYLLDKDASIVFTCFVLSGIYASKEAVSVVLV